jgi:NitT/TauT family transport system permease protein
MFALRSETILAVASPLALLAIWQGVALAHLIDTRFLPPPSQLLGELRDGLRSGQLIRDAAWSLGRIAVGFAFGATAGVIVGALAGLSKTFRGLFGPLFAAMYPIPKTALLPLLVLVFGYSETSKVSLIAISSFFLVQVNTMHGVMTIPQVFIEVARDCGASRTQFIRTVAVPGALPYILAGLRLAWTVELIVIVFVEMTAATDGLGAYIMASWRLFEVDRMMVGMLLLAFIGLVSNLLFDLLIRRLIPWKEQSS